MKSKLLKEGAQRHFAVVLDTGDEVVQRLLDFAREQNLTGSQLEGIGAFQEVVLGYFDLDKKDYVSHTVREQVEVLSLLGNIVVHENQPKLHAHVVVGKRDTTALGGHLIEARVRPTLEVMIVESPGYLQRKLDPETGLPLIEI